MIPVDAEFNRKKSDRLPSLEKYISKFIDTQIEGLYIHQKILLHSYQTETEYVNSEKLSNRVKNSDKLSNHINDDYQLPNLLSTDSGKNSEIKIREFIEERIRYSHDLALKNGFEEFSF